MLGDFSGRVDALARTTAPTPSARKDGRPTVTVRAGSRPAETYQVDYTLGSKRFQGYLSTLPDGRMYVLPVFWHVESGRWLDWKETTPIPDGAHDMKQIWNVNCFNCHATNLDRGYEPARAAYRTHWTELGIGCEACHGPGREHIALTEGWAKDPSTMPRYSSRASNRQLSDDAQDLLAALGRAAPHLRQLRLLPRQQAQPVHHLPGRRPLRGSRAAVPAQRAAARVRRAGRVLARRPAQSLQPAAGADALGLLQGRRDRLHQLPRGARLGQRLLAQGERARRPRRRPAVHAVPPVAAGHADRRRATVPADAGAAAHHQPARPTAPTAGFRGPTSRSPRTRSTTPIPPAAAA